MLKLSKCSEVAVAVDRLSEGAAGDREELAESVNQPVRGGGVPDPEFVERPSRRKFAAEYKLSILKEVEACSKPGERGALLRREGLYSSLLQKWRAQRDAGALSGLEPRKRGRRATDLREARSAALLARAQHAEAQLKTARKVIEVQGNVSALLEELLAQSAQETEEQLPR